MIERQSLLFKECEHLRTHMIRMPAGHIHYAKVVCSDCDKFVRWEPKPETLERQKKNAEILSALALCPDLPPWERGFVRYLATQKHFSPKQQKKLLEVWAYYGEKTDCGK